MKSEDCFGRKAIKKNLEWSNEESEETNMGESLANFNGMTGEKKGKKA